MKIYRRGAMEVGWKAFWHRGTPQYSAGVN